MITTYMVNICPERMEDTDAAIGNYLRANPDRSVDDALDHIFSVGVQVMSALNYTAPNTPLNKELQP